MCAYQCSRVLESWTYPPNQRSQLDIRPSQLLIRE
jgi:hypothetical protein